MSKIEIVKRNDLTNLIINFPNIEVVLSSLGATIIDIQYIDCNGIKESITSHPISIDDFSNNASYCGKTCGPTAGRIYQGKFTIDNKDYQIDTNWLGKCNLHGGKNGVSELNFKVENIVEEYEKITIEFFTTTSNEYIPSLNLKVIYIIENNAITIKYEGYCDEATLCNITNHTYFNLSGNVKRRIFDHNLFINSSNYCEVNNDMIITNILPVDDTFDFRIKKAISSNIYDDKLQKHITKGYDHCYMLDKTNKYDAVLFDPSSKRELKLTTSYPSLVLYTCCYGSDYICANGKEIRQYDAVCLEAQYIPNGINMEVEDKSILRPNEKYNKQIKFEFSIKKD